MLVRAKKTMYGIVMGRSYEFVGYCCNNEYIIVMNEYDTLSPYLVDNFHVESPLTKLEKFKALIESKTFSI